ncbi:DUF2971 domain-containing protein [Devosia sp. SL43]|uniref:DUF2971 domain-containing protein n=1 Tax=Devosia sp. SL43 TaxID=2806348 RepID=UPI001F1AB54D|nr:DUF2971 domain-containing protein [Devosia sp. SL43]UJW86041.1 DUF2971 domain-containing protein [Devosia sp. SL43]
MRPDPFDMMKNQATHEALGERIFYPAQLFHYTNTFGLIKIVSERTIRLTDSLFLNDKTEVRYGADLIWERLKVFTKDWPIGRDLALARRVVREATKYSISDRLAVFCMSGHGELLNQFRDYGKGVQAFSVAFEPQELMNQLAYQVPADELVYPAIIKVIYDQVSQARIVDNLLARLYAKAKELAQDKTITLSERRDLIGMAASQLHYCMVQFKHPAFEAEQEYRLVVTLPDLTSANIPVEFDESPMGPRPYYLLRFRKGLLPISGLIVGPGDHTDVALAGARLLLEAKVPTLVPVSIMDAPLRR